MTVGTARPRFSRCNTSANSDSLGHRIHAGASRRHDLRVEMLDRYPEEDERR
jgi:hypothetical protein